MKNILRHGLTVVLFPLIVAALLLQMAGSVFGAAAAALMGDFFYAKIELQHGFIEFPQDLVDDYVARIRNKATPAAPSPTPTVTAPSQTITPTGDAYPSV